MMRTYNRFRGLAGAAPTVPPLDGPYRPNSALEEAELFCTVDRPDMLVAHRGTPHCVSGGRLRVELMPARPSTAEHYDGRVTALAAGETGELATALEGGTIRFRDGPLERAPVSLPVRADITDLAFDGDAGVFACVGSERNPSDRWAHDLLQRNSAGSLWRVDFATGEAVCLCGSLAYPSGLLVDPGRGVVVCEAWKHRLVVIRPHGRPSELLSNMPGYPWRLSSAGDGGAWLAVMAPRNQLLEFVLREDGYRTRMLAELDPAHWIAPSLRPPDSFLQPMQQGAQRALGRLKPWAPGFSGGMIVRLGPSMQPRYSLFSRADGLRHGILSVLDFQGRLLAASSGAGEILSIPVGTEGQK